MPEPETALAVAAVEQELQRLVGALLQELGGRMGLVRDEADLERDLGLGSLERAELLARVEKRFSVTLPDEVLVDSRTVGALREAIERALREGGAAAGLWRAAASHPSAPDAAADDDTHWRVPPAAEVPTLGSLLRYRGELGAGRVHLRIVDDEGRDHHVTFGELWETATGIGAGLAARGVTRGDRVALLLPTCAAFFQAFSGIQCAGAVPVPIYPPIRMDELAAYVDRHAKLLTNAGARAIICDHQLAPVAKIFRDRVKGLDVVARVDELAAGAGRGVVETGPEDLGLIQYSSGSTGDPKGVALRHRNLIANMHAIGRGARLGRDDVTVSWLPLYHDMGLIGVWLTAMLHGMPMVVLSPLQFLARPERWLWAFHRFGGTIAPAPNFGYEMCVRKVRDADIEGLDLSRWRVAMNGSEPVRPETIDRFCEKFGPYGFRREAMMPVYGLAETSVALTFPPPGRAPRLDRVDQDTFTAERRAVPAAVGSAGVARTLTFVSSGSALPEHEVKVTDAEDPRKGEVPARTEGRILFRGPSTMRDYFERPDATKAAFFDAWVDTGDLGYLADGELFITGRVKDIVIKGGRKYHPQDIELAAWAADGVRKGCVVAFDVPDAQSGEAIVVLAETREPAARHAEIERAVSRAVRDAVGTPADRVVLLPPGTIPKTSSGKLRRRESRQRYLAGELVQRKASRFRQIAGLALRSAPHRAWGLTRRAAAGAFGVYSMGSVVTVSALTALAVGHLCRRERTAWGVARRGLRVAFGLGGLPVRRRGAALPEGPCVIVSNHASYMDGLVVMAGLDRPARFTIKAPAFDWPIFGRAFRKLGALAIDRSGPRGRLRSLAQAGEVLERGHALHIFPEGTFTEATGLRPFRLGAFQLAAERGLPVVPVALRGTREALRADASLFSFARIEVDVLEAIAPPPADAGFREVAALRDRVRRLIAEAVGEPLLEITSAGLPPGVVE
jgi:1-acyl-sn-glycerol-3-phosphate acyltransferase